MKTNILDYIYSGVLIVLIACGTVACVKFGIAPLTRGYTGEYHVIVNILAALLCYGLFSGITVRFLHAIWPLAEGEHSMDAPVFAYWKLLTVIHMFGKWALSPFTNALTQPLVAILFGAKIGPNVAIGGEIQEPYLITLGEGVTLGTGSVVSGSVIQNGKIRIGRVRIGNGVTVGVNSVVLAGTEIGDRASLSVGCFVVPGTAIPAGETWRGNPARQWITPAVRKVESECAA